MVSIHGVTENVKKLGNKIAISASGAISGPKFYYRKILFLNFFTCSVTPCMLTMACYLYVVT